MNKCIFILLFLLCSTAYASQLPEPPVIKDKQVGQYLRTIYDNFYTLRLSDTAPNGNIKGQKGEMILYNNLGTYELWTNKDSAKTWQKI